MDLGTRRHWIFDLDGTLTVPVHDFDAMRRELELPPGEPILEAIAALPPDQAADRRARLHDLEAALADRAVAQPGAVEVLDALRRRGARVGVLTRNDRGLALRTLAVIGLGDHVDPVWCVGRDCAPPKPSPAGIHQLLAGWDASPDDAVMIGDGLFDAQAGRAAGVAVVGFGPRAPAWRATLDRHVVALAELLA